MNQIPYRKYNNKDNKLAKIHEALLSHSTAVPVIRTASNVKQYWYSISVQLSQQSNKHCEIHTSLHKYAGTTCTLKYSNIY